MIPDDYEIELTLVRLVTDRGADKTVCPSEVARALGAPTRDGWGPLMQPVRRQAVRLMKQAASRSCARARWWRPGRFSRVYRLSLPRDADQGPEHRLRIPEAR